MLDELQHFIYENKLLKKGDKILLAVSGGLDSMLMLELLSKLNFQIAVAHCNFLLRGKESNGDEKFVKNYCTKHKIPFFSVHFNTLEYAEKKGISTQMAARDLRYDWFEKVRKEIKFNYVATAHHQTDVAETMLINLLRGSGIAGLHGIAAKKGKIIRPMLFAQRTWIENQAKTINLAYREDSSNSSDDYLRNKIRHWVHPQLEKINPNYEQSFYETANRIAKAEFVLTTSIDAIRKDLEQKSQSEIRYSISKLK